MTYRELLKAISEFDEERMDMRATAYSPASGEYYPVEHFHLSHWADSAFLMLGAEPHDGYEEEE